jgi:hypothetical protein
MDLEKSRPGLEARFFEQDSQKAKSGIMMPVAF